MSNDPKKSSPQIHFSATAFVRTPYAVHIACTVVAVALSPAVSLAASISWSATAGTTAWATGSNWIGNTAPTNDLTTDIAVFNQTSYANQPAAAAFRKINGLVFGDGTTATGTVTITTGVLTGRLQVGSGGITMNANAGAARVGIATANQGVFLGASQTWTNNSSNALTIRQLGNVNGANSSTPYRVTIAGTGSGGVVVEGVVFSGTDSTNPTAGSSVGFKIDGGTLTLASANTIAGGIDLTSGTLLLNNANAAAGGVVVINGGVLGSSTSTTLNATSNGWNFNANFSTAVAASGQLSLYGPITLVGGTRTITVNGGLGFNLYGSIGDSGNGNGIIKSGAEIMRLAGANTYSGDTRVEGGALVIFDNLAAQNSVLDTSGAGSFSFTGGNGATTPTIGGLKGSKSVAVTNGAVLSIALSPAAGSSPVYSGVIGSSGSFSIIKINSGTQVFAATQTYTGTTDIRAGTLQIGDSGTTGGLSLSSVITGSAGGTLAFNRTNTVTQGSDFNSVITGGVGVAQRGSGTLVLNGANTYTGPTTVSAGVLRIGAANAIGNASSVTVDGGGLDLNGFDDEVAAVTLTSGSIFGSGKLTAATYAVAGGAVAANLGSGVLTVTGNSTLNGTSDATTVNLNAGALTLGGANRFTSSAVAVTGSSGASLTLGGNETFGSLAGAANIALGGVTLSVGGANTSTTYSGTVSGAGGLTKAGAGRLTLTAPQAFTGNTVVAGGTLALGSNTSLANSVFLKAGNAANDGGVLDVSAVGGGLSVANGQKLGGYGTVRGDVVIANGAIVSPGGSIGTLDIDGTQTWGPAGRYLFEITNANGVAGNGWDLLTVNSLLITATSFPSQFSIDIQTLTNGTDNVAGAMSLANWDPNTSYQWKFLVADTTTFAATNFNPSWFTINTSASIFKNDINGSFSVARGDTVGGANNELYIVYTAVPEPGAIALAGIGLAVAGTMRLRRRALADNCF